MTMTMRLVRYNCAAIRSFVKTRNVSSSAKLLDDNRRKEVTQKWLDSIVIGQKLCPFANKVKNEPKLRICISNASNHDDIINEISAEAQILVGQEECNTSAETTLVVLNEQKCASLRDFRDLVYLSWRVQDESILQNGFEKELQIVLFHPLAVHDTYTTHKPDTDDDAANYTIRSPFPIIH